MFLSVFLWMLFDGISFYLQLLNATFTRHSVGFSPAMFSWSFIVITSGKLSDLPLFTSPLQLDHIPAPISFTESKSGHELFLRWSDSN